jgi:hypothetical protein
MRTVTPLFLGKIEISLREKPVLACDEGSHASILEKIRNFSA